MVCIGLLIFFKNGLRYLDPCKYFIIFNKLSTLLIISKLILRSYFSNIINSMLVFFCLEI